MRPGRSVAISSNAIANEDAKNEIVLFESEDSMVSLPVEFDGETVWLTRNQMAELYGRDVKTIGKHIGNALREELAGEENRTVAKFATVQMEGEREVSRVVEHYNLDMILSVGYRVKSQRGVEFRRWATQVLRRHIVEGHTENERRLIQLGQVARVMKRLGGSLEANQILSVVESYSRALDLLDAYEHQTIARPSGNGALFSNGWKRLDDNTLVALTIMIAESRPAEKEAMVSLVMNFLL